MSIVDGLGPSLNARVIYRSREEAEKNTGYFSVSAVKVTADLGDRIASYLQEEMLSTWRGSNKRKTSHNIYTLKFTLLLYHTSSRIRPRTKYGWLNIGGAYGALKPWIGCNPPHRDYVDRMKRTPDFDQLYFWICRKYPDDVITVRYRMQPPQS